MNLFSERKKLEEQYKQWIKNNPNVMDCAFSVITFLDLQDRLKNNGEISIRDKIKIKKLADYENAEEQGLLLRLPCKVGTDIYIINRWWIDEGHICGISECDDTDCACFKVYEDPDTYTIVAFDEFGETWFLTREEAEAALKKIQEEQDNDK